MPTHDAAKPLRAPPSGPLAGRIRPPGDKSISHRALMLGGARHRRDRIDGLLEGEDVLRTARRHARLRRHRDEDALPAPGGSTASASAGCSSRKASSTSAMPAPASGSPSGSPAPTPSPPPSSATPRCPAADGPRPRSAARMGVQVLARSGRPPAADDAGPGDAAPDRLSACRWPRRRSSRRCCSPGSTPPASPRSSSRSPRATTPSACCSAFGADIEIETAEDGARTIRIEGRRDLKAQPITVPGDPSSAALPDRRRPDRPGLGRHGRERAPQPDAHRPDRHAGGDGRRHRHRQPPPGRRRGGRRHPRARSTRSRA